MKLTELIPYLVDENKLYQLYEDRNLNPDAEEILIFMRPYIDLDSEIFFFESEETDGEMEITRDGVTYYYFFSTYYASELIAEDLNLKDQGYTDLQIAKRLLEYRLNDA